MILNLYQSLVCHIWTLTHTTLVRAFLLGIAGAGVGSVATGAGQGDAVLGTGTDFDAAVSKSACRRTQTSLLYRNCRVLQAKASAACQPAPGRVMRCPPQTRHPLPPSSRRWTKATSLATRPTSSARYSRLAPGFCLMAGCIGDFHLLSTRATRSTVCSLLEVTGFLVS